MKFRNIIWCTMALLALASCSEADDTVDEYADWQNKNEAWFQALYEQTQAKIAAGDHSWQLIRSYTKGDTMQAVLPEHYIIVHHLDSALIPINDCPLYSDSVAVVYRGWLIPSASYPGGYQFDSSYIGSYDPGVSAPAEFAVNSVTVGFGTALQHMRRGDYWKVYIPYQLGYGKSDYSIIPGYSTLIFEMRLEDFWCEGDD